MSAVPRSTSRSRSRSIDPRSTSIIPTEKSHRGRSKKTPGGAGTHTGHTRDTRAHTGTRITHRRTSQPSKPNDTPGHPHATTRDGRNRGRLNTSTAASAQEQPQARSRPLPAADSEEAAPSEPDPASTRSQSASPRRERGGLLSSLGGYFVIRIRILMYPACVSCRIHES